jgi:hypothetical protein
MPVPRAVTDRTIQLDEQFSRATFAMAMDGTSSPEAAVFDELAQKEYFT